MKDPHRFVCPSCEAYELEPHGRDSVVCPRCGRLAWVVLKTLREISALPDAMGAHACECGHPEMRRLPGRGVPVPGMRLGSPSHLAATLGQDPSNVVEASAHAHPSERSLKVGAVLYFA
jgi:hypothetical protein